MKGLSTLAGFREVCHGYFTCYYFATAGLQNVAGKCSAIKGTPSSKLTLGYGRPEDGKAVATVNLQEAIRSCAEDGLFPDMLAKALVMMIYSEWQEHYRRRAADEVGVKKMQLKCDLMHDLSIVRYWIALRHSVIDEKFKKIRVLNWRLQQGETLKISRDMFGRLIEQINELSVYAA